MRDGYSYFMQQSIQLQMNNENRYPNYFNAYEQDRLSVANKLATMLALIVSFLQKIEILRSKLCGHPNFSPELYYKQIDRCQKGYIDTEDILAFIKKTKPLFNVDHRYLKSLFVRLNQDDRVPSDRLTYFGYLNIIKPYFDSSLAKDVLSRDTIATQTEISLVAKKLLEDLICSLYVCVAQHQRIKQLIILGDVEQGGKEPGRLYNIYQMLDIVKAGSQSASSNTIPINIQPEPIIRSHANITGRTNNIASNVNIRPNPPNNAFGSQTSINGGIPNININPPSNQVIDSQVSISSSSLSRKQGTLDIFHKFIRNNSQYEIQRRDMKYLLAYLMCHQYMIVQDKYLSLLFMPVSALVSISATQHVPAKNHPNQTQKYFYQNENRMSTGQTNFLDYVHKNSVSREALQKQKKNKQAHNKKYPPSSRSNHHSHRPAYDHSNPLIDQEPRILINPPENNLQTPILQRFLRESKVLKNMSRYNPPIQEQNSFSESSAFVSEGRSANQLNTSRNKNNIHKNQHLDPKKYVGHTQKPVNKDFNLDVLQNSNLHRSQYYNNLSQRAYIKDQPLRPADVLSPRKIYDDDSGHSILNNFLRR